MVKHRIVNPENVTKHYSLIIRTQNIVSLCQSILLFIGVQFVAMQQKCYENLFLLLEKLLKKKSLIWDMLIKIFFIILKSKNAIYSNSISHSNHILSLVPLCQERLQCKSCVVFAHSFVSLKFSSTRKREKYLILKAYTPQTFICYFFAARQTQIFHGFVTRDFWLPGSTWRRIPNKSSSSSKNATCTGGKEIKVTLILFARVHKWTL